MGKDRDINEQENDLDESTVIVPEDYMGGIGEDPEETLPEDNKEAVNSTTGK